MAGRCDQGVVHIDAKAITLSHESDVVHVSCSFAPRLTGAVGKEFRCNLGAKQKKAKAAVDAERRAIGRAVTAAKPKAYAQQFAVIESYIRVHLISSKVPADASASAMTEGWFGRKVILNHEYLEARSGTNPGATDTIRAGVAGRDLPD